MDEFSDDEFDLLDELYFVQHFEEIKENLEWQAPKLITILKQLIEKGCVKALIDHDTEYYTAAELENEALKWLELYFLATKKGLMLHNGF